jgi:glycosyltransferase involved in cell wall biosynthesis
VRIVIDLQGAQSESHHRGIGRYSLSLALSMAQNAGQHDILLALNGRFPDSVLSLRQAFDGCIPSENIHVFDVPAQVAEMNSANRWRTQASEKMREYFLQTLKPDVVHVSSLFEGYGDDAITSVGAFDLNLRTAVTLYDLIPFLNQADYLPTPNHRDYCLRKIESLKKADLLLAISESSRREAMEALSLSAHQVLNISAAVDGQFHPVALTQSRIEALQQQYGITRKIILYAPGGFDSRKNFENLIEAYAMLSAANRKNHQLVIVGHITAERRLYLNEQAKKAGLAKDELVLTGYLLNEVLVEFYNLASLFVFPSKHEGFGLPVLEAMACGAPVIGSNITSIPEVIDFPEALFDPFSAKGIAEKMTQVLGDDSLRHALSLHGVKQAKQFTWDVCAKRAIAGFEERFDVSCHPRRVNSSVDASALFESVMTSHVYVKPTDSDLVQVAECIAFNSGQIKRRQLLLDISELVRVDAKSGIQRVVRSLLQELVHRTFENIDVEAIYFDGKHYRYASRFMTTFRGEAADTLADEIVDFCQNDIYLALDLTAHDAFVTHDFYKKLQCRGIKLYFIVYDLLFLQRPDWWTEGVSSVLENWLRCISDVATGLICISESVVQEVQDWLKSNSSQYASMPAVSAFHLGADVENSLPSKGLPDNAFKTLHQLNQKRSFLMVSTLEPRKGHAQTLAAFELLWAQGVDVNLVIIGKCGWLVDDLVKKIRNHPELNHRLFWLEAISDEYLEKVYAASCCLIVASEGEGFGLPLIEAAKQKLNIIARELPVFREIAGDCAYYFEGLEPEAIVSAVQAWIEQDELGNVPISANIPWLTWRQSSDRLVKQIGLGV